MANYHRPRRSVYNPGYFGLAQHRHEFPRRSVYTPGYFGLADGAADAGASRQPAAESGSTEGDVAQKEIMDGYAQSLNLDINSQPIGPVLPTGEFDGTMPSENGEATDHRAGTPMLEQVAIWGTVGLLGYFLVGPFLGIKN